MKQPGLHIDLRPLSDAAEIAAIRADYLATLRHPLDDFLDGSFIRPAPHLEIRVDGRRAGMIVRNQEGRLLLFHLLAPFRDDAVAIFDAIRASSEGEVPIQTATVSTGDPLLLGNALRVGIGAEVSDYLFAEPPDGQSPPPALAPVAGHRITVAGPEDLTGAVAFCRRCVPSAADWLETYLGHLIDRNELYLVTCAGDIRGSGELRVNDEQPPWANLGMIVDPAFRRRGLATFIMRALRQECRRRGLRAVCSTRVDNVGAQRAIERAGFIPVHRVLDVAVGRG